ncbi:Fatty acid synthase [Eumeta japonica]|uniref:oleoyl-[acyl-carrier-protein] hydrolase n=1 Tax=Eumeta variegata TaxID=151549 RepID=A0A4C1ZX54_EUMVA|nr:Fatty acid synthase [Eumeta japonica]
MMILRNKAQVRYFVVLRPTADRTEPKSKRVCARRALEGLPALYLNMPTLAKFEERKEVNQSIGSALDALETSLRLRHRDAVTCASRDAPECDLLDKVGDLLGASIKELPGDTTLRSLGLDFEKAEMIKNVLERRYKYPCSRRNLPDITVGRLSEIAMKLANLTKPKPTKLEIFFRSVDPDELTSSAELLVMQTLVYEPLIRSDQFFSKETYLILVPGMEGHHGVFNTLCERLKIFALCMQPGLDHPRETPRQTALRFVKNILKMIELKENFYLLGYSYGVLVALEMAALLEEKELDALKFFLLGRMIATAKKDDGDESANSGEVVKEIQREKRQIYVAFSNIFV